MADFLQRKGCQVQKPLPELQKAPADDLWDCLDRFAKCQEMQGQCALDNCHFQQKTMDALSAFEQQMTTLVTKEQFGKEKAEVVLGLEEFINKNVKQLSD